MLTMNSSGAQDRLIDLFDVAFQAYRIGERERRRERRTRRETIVIRSRRRSRPPSLCSFRQAFIDPTGLVPVVNEVEGLRRQRPHSTVASTDARSAGGSQA